MYKGSTVIILLALVIGGMLLFGIGIIFRGENTNDKQFSQRGDMELRSSAFANNERIPSRYTCDGDNVSPELRISGVPADTQSLVLIVDDPDAPLGDWVHWVVWNIAPGVTLIPEKTVPPGATEGQTDFGQSGYGGPCPPSGTHRYVFKLYALDSEVDLQSNTRKAEVEKAMSGHILAQTQLVGLYERQR